MHLLLTDRMACPRCGPAFGLILLADRLAERRVVAGSLGCPNCRARYRIEGGRADLRFAPSEDPEPPLEPEDGQGAVRLAALLGIREGPAAVLLTGDAGRFAPTLADLVPGVDWIVTHPGSEAWAERAGVDRIRVGARLPFFDRALRGAVLRAADPSTLDECCRVVHDRGRVVVEAPESFVAERLRANGFQIVLDDPEAVVGERGRA